MASKKFSLEADVRKDVGKGASRRLGREERVPGVVYGGGKDATSLSFEHKHLVKALESEAFYSSIISLKAGHDTDRVILKDVQRHPFKPRIVHIDFQRIRADQKLHMNVPLHFMGADKAPGVKEGGLISHIMSDVEVSCLPDNLPEYLELDVSALKMNETLHLSDIKLPNGVELIDLLHENDKPVVSIHMPREEVEEPAATEPVSAEVPAIEQKSEAELAAEASKDKDKKK